MSLRNVFYVFLFACLILPASSIATAGGHHDQFGMWPMRGLATDQQIDQAVDSLQRALNLSATQAGDVKQLVRSRRDTLQSIREQAKPKFQQLMTLLKQPNPDAAAVGRATIELKKIHDKAHEEQADVESRFLSMLTPSQLQTVNSLRDQASTFRALARLGLLGSPEHGRLMSSILDEH